MNHKVSKTKRKEHSPMDLLAEITGRALESGKRASSDSNIIIFLVSCYQVSWETLVVEFLGV